MKKMNKVAVRNESTKTDKIRSVFLFCILFQPVAEYVSCTDKRKLHLTLCFLAHGFHGKNQPFQIFIWIHISHRNNEGWRYVIPRKKLIFFFVVLRNRKRIGITCFICHHNQIFSERKPFDKLCFYIQARNKNLP